MAVTSNIKPAVPHKRKLLRGWWLLLPFQLLLISLLGMPQTRAGLLLQTLHLLTAALCAFGLSKDQRPFSLNQVFWVFMFVFMGLMPSVFYSLNFLPYGLVPESLLLKASGLVLGCSLLYTLTSRGLSLIFREPAFQQKIMVTSQEQLPKHFKRSAPWLIGLCVLAMIIIIGPANLWMPIPFWEALERRVPDSMLQLLVQYGLRGAMLSVCLAAAYYYRQQKISGKLLFFLILLAVIGNFPLSLSRFLAGAFYLSILLWALPLRWLKPPRVAVMLLALILLAAPLLNAPRMQHFTVAPGEQRDFSFLMRTSYGSDYDAYALLCRTMQYTDSLGNTGGRQLAGALLFFVPRSKWPQKPVGSGSMVFDTTAPRSDHWNNVSCPFLGEGYVNFGLVGSLVFTLLLAAAIFFYDRKFWNRIKHHRPLSYPVLFYPVLVGLLLLWLRGDLLGATAYATGLFLSGWVAYLFFRKL